MNTTQEALAGLRHSSATIRAEAARYLSENPTADAEPALVAALADSVPEVRNATAYALGQLRQPAAATIASLRRTPNPRTYSAFTPAGGDRTSASMAASTIRSAELVVGQPHVPHRSSQAAQTRALS